MDDDTYNTFWGHIEELRGIFLRFLVVVILGFILTLFFYEPIFQFLVPAKLTNSTFVPETLLHKRIRNPSDQALVYTLPDHAIPPKDADGVKKIENHSYLVEGGHYLDYEIPINESRLVLLSPLEGVLLTFKVCFWLSLAGTSPIWVFLLLRFVLPALKKQEKKMIFPFIVSSFVSIFLGIVLARYVSIPIANQYLESFNAGIGENFWSLAHYIDYTFILFLGHAITAELCLILLFGVHFRVIKVDWLIAKRRYMIVLAFILGAILTPPDVLTQLLVAIPLIAVYELAILYGKIRTNHPAI